MLSRNILDDEYPKPGKCGVQSSEQKLWIKIFTQHGYTAQRRTCSDCADTLTFILPSQAALSFLVVHIIFKTDNGQIIRTFTEQLRLHYFSSSPGV